MAKDIIETEKSFDFHPCDTPRGMLYYDMEVLTDDQQIKLNNLRVQTVRDDQIYLAQHPEIRACIALLTRQVLRERPRNNIHEAIARFFARSRVDIESEINDYLLEREPHTYEGNSAVRTPSSLPTISSFNSENELSNDSFRDDEELIDDTCDPWDDFGFSESLQNIGLDFKKITRVKNLSSDTVIHSISVITGMYMDAMITDTTYDLARDIIEEDILKKIITDEDDETLIKQETYSYVESSRKPRVIKNITDLHLPVLKESIYGNVQSFDDKGNIIGETDQRDNSAPKVEHSNVDTKKNDESK